MISFCLLVFFALGTFDGLYFHLHVYQLHRWPQSRTEHLIHTARSFVFVPIALLLFGIDTAGTALWIGMAFVVGDLGLEVLDILVEKNSRALLGGVSPAESLLHVMATGFRMSALALCLAAKPASAWDLGARAVLTPGYPPLQTFLGIAFAATCLVGGAAHLAITGITYRNSSTINASDGESLAR